MHSLVTGFRSCASGDLLDPFTDDVGSFEASECSTRRASAGRTSSWALSISNLRQSQIEMEYRDMVTGPYDSTQPLSAFKASR